LLPLTVQSQPVRPLAAVTHVAVGTLWRSNDSMVEQDTVAHDAGKFTVVLKFVVTCLVTLAPAKSMRPESVELDDTSVTAAQN
jgi:hypothetical protein